MASRRPYEYRSAFAKHLYNLSINGFYSRDLDAEDFAFIEHVRQTGSANGSVPDNEPFRGEAGSWSPAPHVFPAHPGSDYAAAVPTAAQAERREIIRQTKLAERLDRDRRAAELRRVVRDWQTRHEARRLKQQISDEEWEAADPDRKSPRHHVPHWKVAELRAEKKRVRLDRIEARRKREHAITIAKQQRLEVKRRAEAKASEVAAAKKREADRVAKIVEAEARSVRMAEWERTREAAARDQKIFEEEVRREAEQRRREEERKQRENLTEEKINAWAKRERASIEAQIASQRQACLDRMWAATTQAERNAVQRDWEDRVIEFQRARQQITDHVAKLHEWRRAMELSR